MSKSDPYPSNLLGSELLAGAIVELGRSRRFMIGDGLRVLQGSAVFEIGGDAGRTKGMAAGRVGQPSSLGSALDHVEHVKSRHGFFT